MIRLAIILIIGAALWLLWPRITRWLTRWALGRIQRRTEDMWRQAAGMPPREEEKKQKRKSAFRQTDDTGEGRGAAGGYAASGASRSRRGPRRGYSRGPLIPKEYAVDVEFVEIHEYSSQTVIGSDGRRERVEEWHESQVTDAEWVEIRDSGK